MAETKKNDESVASGYRSPVTREMDRKKAKVRKVYAHAMTPTDKVALRTVLAAKNVCTALAVAIQDGKPVKAETMQACLMLQNEAMSMLF